MPSVEEVSGLRLNAFVESGRALKLDKYDLYYRSKQYDQRRYTWDGRLRGPNEGDADIEPGWYIPLAHRRPTTKVHMAKKTVQRLTDMTLGGERFPKINVHGDDDAEDFAQELVRASHLSSKMVQARNKGGACGTGVISWAFIDGKPRVKVHSAKQCFVLRWMDRDDRRPAAVLETYRYERTLIIDGKPEPKCFYYARVWTENDDTIWEPIPEDMARDGTWPSAVPSISAEHNFGFCPVYWVQNIEEDDEDDGLSDFDGLCEDFDSMSTLASQVTKGTTANADPTLVIKDKPQEANKGSVRKGSEHAIFSEKGAEYLELKGDAVRAGIEWLREMHAQCAEVMSVVFPDPEALAGAKSAAALRVLYGPMLTKCDTYRTQYGDYAILPIVRDMLEVSRRVFNATGGPIERTVEGQRIQRVPTILLDDRVIESKSETGEVVQTTKPRNPGKSSSCSLNWPPYFPDTWADISLAVEASVKATGGKAIISQETAVKNISPKFGVTNAEEELERIEEDADKADERAQAQLQGQLTAESLYGPGSGAEAQGKPKTKSDDE